MLVKMKFGVGALQKRLAIESKTGVIVLSRFSSSRLPGKALLEIEGKPVLAYIIEKLEHVVSKNQIIIATSNEESDDPIADFASKAGVQCYRGSLENVAERFYEAAERLDCSYACRINGDNIFLDPEVLREMLRVAQSSKYDFLSNVKGRTFPKGMSVEVVKLDYFRQNLEVINLDEHYREHVMLYLYEKSETDRHFYLKSESLPEAAGLQLALDTPEDLKRSRWILKNLQLPHYQAGMKEILKLTSDYERSIKG